MALLEAIVFVVVVDFVVDVDVDVVVVVVAVAFLLFLIPLYVSVVKRYLTEVPEGYR